MQPLIAALSLIGWPKRAVDMPPIAEDAPVLPRVVHDEFVNSRDEVAKQRAALFPSLDSRLGRR